MFLSVRDLSHENLYGSLCGKSLCAGRVCVWPSNRSVLSIKSVKACIDILGFSSVRDGSVTRLADCHMEYDVILCLLLCLGMCFDQCSRLLTELRK